jgi:prepilin-type N-terminal cleavage/methylation domain-containing protein
MNNDCSNSKFQSPYNFQKGFTLIELILVIAIISILMALSASIGSSFLVRNYTQNTVNDLISKLRIAQLNSLLAKKDKEWGVRIQGNQIILFAGTSYTTRDVSVDEVTPYPNTISIGPNNSEYVFTKLTGNSNVATITISNNIGESEVININQEGIVDVN